MAGGDRSRADAVLVGSLAAGSTIADAAKKAHVGERTVYRRLEDTAFVEQVERCRGEMVDRVVGALAAASGEAVSTLLALLATDVTSTVRLGAAKAIIDLGVKTRDAEETARRLAELEEVVAGLRGAARMLGEPGQ